MTYLMSLIGQVTDVPLADVLSTVLAFVGGLKGASALAISVGVVQILIKVMSSSLGGFAGKYKLLAVYGLSVAAAIITNLVSGQGIVNAVMSGSVLAAVQVLAHQIYTQFIAKPAAPAA